MAGIRPRRVKCRHQTGRDTRAHGHGRAETKRKTIELDARLVRDEEHRHQIDDQTCEGERTCQTGDAAQQREHDALEQQLTNDSDAAGAERDPNGDLACPRGSAGKLQVRDVGARDEQQERDRPEQEPQTAAHLATRDRDIQVIRERCRERVLRKTRRIRDGELALETVQLLFGRRW